MIPKKLEIHQSTLTDMFMCPASVALVKKHGKVPSNFFLIAGSGCHDGIAANLKNKAVKEELLPLDEVQDVARDKVNKLSEGEVLLNPDEKTIGKKELTGEAVDKAITLAELHHIIWAPGTDPMVKKSPDGKILADSEGKPIIGVERKWRVDVDGMDWYLAGTMDLQEKSNHIFDWKTTEGQVKPNAAHESMQLTMYAMASEVHGEPSPAQGLVYLQYQKTQVATQILWTDRNNEDYAVLLRRINAAVEQIKAGAYPPCAEGHWKCSPKWCYWHLTNKCPHVSNKVFMYPAGHDGNTGEGTRRIFKRVDVGMTHIGEEVIKVKKEKKVKT